MNLSEIYNASIEIVTDEPHNGIWFQHQSPEKLKIIKPQTYSRLEIIRPGYPVEDRKDHEKVYRKLTNQKNNLSFTYATVVGYHMMGTPKSYDGYTYYFRLSNEKLKRTIFEVVATGKDWMKPTLGEPGLNKAMNIWKIHHYEFKNTHEKDIGTIFSRIEVVIPFNIVPVKVFLQKEDR